MAQIEIMQADLPHTLYLQDRKEDRRGHKVTNADLNTVADDEVIRLQEEANRRMQERREAKARGEIPYTTNELFKR